MAFRGQLLQDFDADHSAAQAAGGASVAVTQRAGMRIGAVAIALYEDKDPDKAIELLQDEEQRRGWAVSTTALVPLWKAAWQLKIKKELGRDLTALEAIKTRREHPPPASIFFGGAT